MDQLAKAVFQDLADIQVNQDIQDLAVQVYQDTLDIQAAVYLDILDLADILAQLAHRVFLDFQASVDLADIQDQAFLDILAFQA